MIKRIINFPLSVGSYTVGVAVVMTHLALAGRGDRRQRRSLPPGR